MVNEVETAAMLHEASNEACDCWSKYRQKQYEMNTRNKGDGRSNWGTRALLGLW